MEMEEDDDEFGDLYSDVLRPISSSSAPPPHPQTLRSSPNPPSEFLIGIADSDSDAEEKILIAPSRSAPSQTIVPFPEEDKDDEDWLLSRAPAAVEPPENWGEEDDEVAEARVSEVPFSDSPDEAEPRVFNEEEDVRVSGSIDPADKVTDAEGFRVPEEKKIEIGDLDQEPVIPGLSAGNGPLAPGPLQNGGEAKVSGSDDWDSDSDDDLQIVLNDNNYWPLGGERNDGAGIGNNDDEDGEKDLVIVTDEDQHQHHQAMEEQDWGEEVLQPAADGERKEISETAKANGAIGSAAGPRIGYSNHGFHPQNHSMYKYIRPGAAPVPGGPVVGSIGPPGHIHPPPTLGPTAGCGRGDWRPAGGRGISNAQKNFHSGYGLPVWSNNSGRAFRSGLDFTLPSHKTVFDIDIESFEEKPWRHPGVDISVFFNFGLDEDNWKDYCKQLEQLRLESTMQSKIRVYESGRSEQDYDPDLPPELAAAAGHHDIYSDNLHHGKVDNGQADLNGQGRGVPCIRAPLPTGRAIQVESGYGERLPSIDTRPPRIRDSDAIIEIHLQETMDDSTTYNGASVQTEKDIQGEQLKGVRDAEDNRHVESEYFDRLPHDFNGRKREMVTRRVLGAPVGDGILPSPSESALHYHPNSKLRSPVNSGGSFGTHRGGRLTQGTSRGRYSSTSGEHSNNVVPSRCSQVNKHDDHQKENQKEKPGDSMEGNQTAEASPAIAVETEGELSIEQRDGEHDDRLALGDSVEVGGDETSDFRISSETLGDGSLHHSSKKQKLSSRVEQPAILYNGDDDDLRTTHSDNSRAKSGSSKDHLKRRESGEEVERMSDLRRHHEEEERNFRRKDDYGWDGRHRIDRSRMDSKGREPIYHSYPHRDWDSNSAHPVRGRSECFERPRETDGSIWQRREDDIQSRRVKDDCRGEYNGETGSRNKSKVRVSDRSDKDDDLHSKKKVDDGDWIGHNRGGPRQRERDDALMNRRENIDDHQVRRKKDEEHSRRERADKEDTLHGYKAREDSSRRKRERERDDGSDHRREDSTRIRDKAEDHHSAKHKEESWQQREREERQRLKQPREDSLTHREREEGRGATRSGRTIEDKPLGGNGRNKDDSKGMGSAKDYQHKDRRWHNEQSRRADRAGEENDPQYKGRDDVYAREKQFHSEERSLRHDRLSTHNDRPSSASDNQQMYRERHRESTRKSKDNEGSGQNPQGTNKRKHEDHNTHRNEKMGSKGTNEQERNNASTTLSKKGHHHVREQPDAPQLLHSLGKHGEEEPASDDEKQLEESRRGRSKLERWTSHKERDYNTLDSSSSARAKETEGTNADKVVAGELPKREGNNAANPDSKGADAGQVTDRTGEDNDRHLDTVAKLKRRSERFKLPMPGEKDTTMSKKVESEPQITQSEAAASAADAEVKPERPARKRRWTSS